MRNLVLCGLMLIATVMIGQTWTEVSYNYQGKATNKRYTFNTDSVLMNQNWYHELLISWDETGDNWDNTGQFLRKSGSRIYQIVDNEEHTVYDFSLITGDTFAITASLTPEVKLIVTQVDSVTLLDNSKRKRLHLRCEGDPDGTWYGERIWIEGLGDLQGLLSLDRSCSVDQNTKLLCYHEDDQILYQDTIKGKCWIISNTKQLGIYDIKVFPNPVRNKLVITGLKGETTYRIYSSEGMTAKEGKVIGEIDIRTLSSGLYLLQLINESSTHTMSIIKQ